MNILYVVGNGSEWDNNELRYSLRSLEKYGHNVGRVFIVGSCPEFINKEVVTFIPCSDPYTRPRMPHKNILHKVLYAIKHSDIGRHFLISSDDHYYVQQTDFDNLPVYFKKEDIPTIIPPGQLGNPYPKSLKLTRELLRNYNLTTYQTNPHCNTHFDVDLYEENKCLFDDCFRIKWGGELNCVMGNLLYRSGATPVRFDDAKLKRSLSESDIAARAMQTNCLSSVPDMKGSNMAAYLQKKFENKSQYEL